MKWNSNIQPSELPEYKDLFNNLDNKFILGIIIRVLNGISQFIGYPIGIIIPNDVAEFKDNPEDLRALRLLVRLREAGIISSFYTESQIYPDEPSSYITLATLNQMYRFGFSGKGAHLTNKSATLWPAAGEAVERYATQFNYPKKGEYIDASYKEIKNSKADIFAIAGFDDNLRSKKHPLFTFMYDENTKFRWVKAFDPIYKKSLWAPLQWFSFSHVQNHVRKSDENDSSKEPLLSIPITTGAATGQNTTDALTRGLLEVIERDAFIIYWLNQIPAKKIDLHSFKEDRFNELIEIAEKYKLEVHLLYLQTDINVHTVCSIVIDRSGIGPAFIVGAKTGFDLSDVAYGSFGETLAQRGIYRRMMDNDKNKDRSYADISSIDHELRMYYWYRHASLKEAEQFISGEIVDVQTLPKYQYTDNTEENLSKLLKIFEEKEYQVLYRELLNDELTKLTEGLSVVMVKVPQMQPVYLEEGLRLIGGKRLRDVPKILGYDVDSTSADPFSVIPHPFP